jgi:hypothetical protein
MFTFDEINSHIKKNVTDYSATVVVAALFAKLYKRFPKIGLSGAQAEMAEELISQLDERY